MQQGNLVQDRYELRERIGRGGMADVWCARDLRLDRSVAVKFLAPRLANDPEFLVRFFTEAQIVARISDPAVVGILDFGQYDGRPFLVMEYVSGGVLSDLVGEAVTAERASDLVAQAARGVGAAHALGLVHRDIKPGNILLDEEGRAKIADFGIACGTGAERFTGTGTAIGSPHYISPEQVSGQEITPRSDVYAFGVVLFELLTGRKPFDGENVTAVAIAHVDERAPAPSSLNPDVPPELDALVARCLAKDPAERFADARELAEALESFAATGLPAALGIGMADPAGDEAGSRPRVLAGTVVILLLLGLASAGVLASARSDDAPAAPPEEGTQAAAPPALSSPSPSPVVSTYPAAASSDRPAGEKENDEEKERDENQKAAGKSSADDADADAEEASDTEAEAEPSSNPDPSPTSDPEPSPESSPDSGEQPAPEPSSSP